MSMQQATLPTQAGIGQLVTAELAMPVGRGRRGNRSTDR